MLTNMQHINVLLIDTAVSYSKKLTLTFDIKKITHYPLIKNYLIKSIYTLNRIFLDYLYIFYYINL